MNKLHLIGDKIWWTIWDCFKLINYYNLERLEMTTLNKLKTLINLSLLIVFYFLIVSNQQYCQLDYFLNFDFSRVEI